MKEIWNWIRKHPFWTIFIFWWLVTLVILGITFSQSGESSEPGMDQLFGVIGAILCAVIAPVLTYLVFRIVIFAVLLFRHPEKIAKWKEKVVKWIRLHSLVMKWTGVTVLITVALIAFFGFIDPWLRTETWRSQLKTNPEVIQSTSLIRKPVDTIMIPSGQPSKWGDVTFSPDNKQIINGECVFSSDSKHEAHVETFDGQQYVVIDGVADKGYHWIEASSFINRMIFSPDSQHVAYHAEVGKNGKQIVIVDGAEGKPYDCMAGQITGLTFSPDSKHVAYIVAERFVVLDGEETEHYASPWRVLQIAFSSDGKLAYKVGTPQAQERKFFVVFDGKQGKTYDELNRRVGKIIFSADGQHLAYGARDGDKSFIVMDGVEGKGYSDVGSEAGAIVFSPDSQRLAYTAMDKWWLFRRWFVVADGVEGMKFHGDSWFQDNGITDIIFSPDSKRLAYTAKDTYGVIDGVRSKRYHYVGNIVFSPDSSMVAYSAGGLSSGFVVINGYECKKYYYVNSPTFSPDSKHLVYWAMEGYWNDSKDAFDSSQRIVRAVIDGTEGKEYKSTWYDDRFVFDQPNLLRYIVIDNAGIHVIEEMLE
jgi:WD40 repeat protein